MEKIYCVIKCYVYNMVYLIQTQREDESVGTTGCEFKRCTVTALVGRSSGEIRGSRAWHLLYCIDFGFVT
jgi:hypothetical protein